MSTATSPIDSPQVIEFPRKGNKRIRSNKSAAKIAPSVREDMLDSLMQHPDPDSLTEQYGSSLANVILGSLYAAAWKVRRLEEKWAQRDGFGAPAIVHRKPMAREVVQQIRKGAAA